MTVSGRSSREGTPPRIRHLRRHPRTGIYWFRIAVPVELRDQLGRVEIVCSLRTRSEQEACRKLAAVRADAERRIDRARQEMRGHSPELPRRFLPQVSSDPPLVSSPVKGQDGLLTSAGAVALSKSWERWAWVIEMEGLTLPSVTPADEIYSRTRVSAECEAWFRDALDRTDPGPFEGFIQFFAGQYGFLVQPGSRNQMLLGLELLRAAIRHEQRLRAWLRGEEIEPPVVPATQDLPEPQRASTSTFTLSQAFADYASLRRLDAKAHAQAETALRRFVEVVGDLRLDQLDRSHAKSFAAALLDLPARLPPADRMLSIPELRRRYQNSQVRRVTVTTVRRDMAMVQAIIEHCVQSGELAENPFAGMKPAKPVSGSAPRRPYDVAALQTIFSSPLYVGCRSASKRWEPGAVIIRDACWWLPLLGAFTGCRLEELGQLRVTDVRQESSIPVLDINTNDPGKSVKSAGSRRLVPVHPVLIRLGLLRLAEDLTRRGEIFLFPDLKPNRFGIRTASWSKWWGRYSTAIGLDDRRLVFHSFRHGFKDACRDSGISKDIHDVLTGHAPVNVGDRYGSGHSIRTLAEAMAKVQYEGLDLTHLTG